MKFYELLSRLKWPMTYTGKILFVSFIGVHVPMIGAVTYALLGDSTPLVEQLDVLAAMLLATLLGTAGTLIAVFALLAPVRAASAAADDYLRHRDTPRLPTRFTDGAGVLMASVQECITRLDASIATTEERYTALERDYSENVKTISGMKHDFRTPLTHIIGFANLMKSEAIGPLGNATYQSFANKIGRSGQELLTTLNTMIDLSDTQCMDQTAQDNETIDIIALAQDAINLEHLHAEHADVTVTLEGPERLYFDTVEPVVKNIIGTMLQAAVSATPKGGEVRLILSECVMSTTIRVESQTGEFTLEDVPARMAECLDGLRSGAGTQGDIAESATPTTLRLALIDTLGRTLGTNLRLRQSANEGLALEVVIKRIVDPSRQIAA